MPNFKRTLKKISSWRGRPDSSQPLGNTEYKFEVQVGLKTKIKRAVRQSAHTSEYNPRRLLSTRKAPASEGKVDAVTVYADGSKPVTRRVGVPFQGQSSGAGHVAESETPPSNTINFAHTSNDENCDKWSLKANPAADEESRPQEEVLAKTSSGEGETGSPSISATNSSRDRSHCEDRGVDTLEDNAWRSEGQVGTSMTDDPTLDLANLSSKDSMRIDPFTKSGQSTSRINSTEITSPSLDQSVTTPDKNLALIPYKPIRWSSPLTEGSTLPNTKKISDSDVPTTEVTTFPTPNSVACNCQERHAEELACLRDELKEEYEIELEIQTEKLQEKHDEKVKKLQSELYHTISSRDYVKLLGRKKLDRAIDDKEKVEQNLQAVEAILKVKDTVIEQAETKSARLQGKVDALELEKETLIQDHAATLSKIREHIIDYAADRDARIKSLVDQLKLATASSSEPDLHGATDVEIIRYLEDRPAVAALAYMNARKELTSADKQLVELQNQLNCFNGEFDQDPARLAGVTRLLELKDGRILELQRIAGEYHDALKQSRAERIQDENHAKAEVKVQKDKVDLLYKQKADVQTRFEDTRQGWENVAQMFGRQVFGEDIAKSMNELYDIVKDDNAFLCKTVEAHNDRITHLLENEKHLKMKILDHEQAAEQSEKDSQQLQKDVRAAEYAVETGKIEMDVRVNVLQKQTVDKDAAIAALTEKVVNLRETVDATFSPSKASAILLKQKDAEIASLTLQLQKTRSVKEELEEQSKSYEDLKSWKVVFDRTEAQQEFQIRGLREMVVKLEEQLRAALLASVPASFEAARSMMQELGRMADAWNALKADRDRIQRRSDQDLELLCNERLYFTASMRAAKETLMAVWRRYQSLWNGIRNQNIVPVDDAIGPQEIADRVEQIFQEDDTQQAGNDAISQEARVSATDRLGNRPYIERPEAEHEIYGNQLVDAAQALLEHRSVLAVEPAAGSSLSPGAAESLIPRSLMRAREYGMYPNALSECKFPRENRTKTLNHRAESTAVQKLLNMYPVLSSKNQHEGSDCEAALLDYQDEIDLNDEKPQLNHLHEKDYTPTHLLSLLSRSFATTLLSTSKGSLSNFASGQWYFQPIELLPAWWKWTESPPPKLHPTSWLDGLRGVAALIVFFHHSSQIWFRGLRPGWASNPDAYHIMQLPVLRILFSGGAMVSIFFVISGYVLSTKPLKLARQGRYEELSENLASSVFRRGPRLFVPCIVSTFLTAILTMTGAFVDEGVSRHYPHAGTLWEQMASWVHETLWFINPFAGGTGFEENLWTIPTEFQGSLLVFICALGLSRCRNVVRLGCLILFIGYWLWFGYWATVLFLGGIVLAELDHGRSLPGVDLTCVPKTQTNDRKRTVWYGVLVFVAIFFLSMPEYDESVTSSFGYVTLSTTLTPASWMNHWGPGRWWPCLSSILLVAVIDNAGSDAFYQRLFTYRFPQYLGRVSFSLYLCHGVTLYTVGLRTANFFLGIFGDKTGLQYGLALVVSGMIMVPILFWVSDVFTVVVDRGAVVLSRKMMNFRSE
ncbi:MAG: hypothetical protein Q9166_005399 [cf. Caloplaca sp. 2 TL-2023]